MYRPMDLVKHPAGCLLYLFHLFALFSQIFVLFLKTIVSAFSYILFVILFKHMLQF